MNFYVCVDAGNLHLKTIIGIWFGGSHRREVLRLQIAKVIFKELKVKIARELSGTNLKTKRFRLNCYPSPSWRLSDYTRLGDVGAVVPGRYAFGAASAIRVAPMTKACGFDQIREMTLTREGFDDPIPFPL